MELPRFILRDTAHAWLIEAGVSENHTRYEEWLGKATDLYARYVVLKAKHDRPLTIWGDEPTDNMDAILEELDRKITAAEEVLGRLL